MVFRVLLVLVAVAVANVIGQRNIGLTGPQLRALEVGQNPNLLELAALTGETVMIVLDGPETLAAVQEAVNANIWCLPWLLRFPGAEAVWRFGGYDPFFTTPGVAAMDDTGQYTEIIPPGDIRRRIGGELNEWLNISGTLLSPGAEGSDTGRYQCQACYFRGTPFEECHSANLSLQVIGGPPEIDKGQPDDGPIDGGETYRVGTDFCVSPNFTGDIDIRCDVLPGNSFNRSQPFPLFDRAWFFEDDNLYRGSNPTDIRNNVEFFATRMRLMPDFFIPTVLTATPEGGIALNLGLRNISMESSMTLEELRLLARQDIIGTWRCEVNNTFGTDVAESTIRTCGAAPMLPGCLQPDGLVIAQPGDTINIGCIVCIRQGDVITLDCTGASETSVTYEWVNSENETVSTGATFTTGMADSYTCTATNIDNPSESETTILAFSDALSFTGEITEQMLFEPRMDNGCSRLGAVNLPNVNSTVGSGNTESLDFCAFVGERLDFRCLTDDENMQPLEITSPSGVLSNGTLTVDSVMQGDAGDYVCRLSTVSGPCSQASSTFVVDVFEPARIRRTVTSTNCNFVAGAQSGPVVVQTLTIVTLCCPVSGIEVPVQAWYRIDVDEFGCATETFIEGGVSGPTENNELEIDVTEDVTYVCRTQNSAGQDADIISIRTDVVMAEWDTGQFSDCDLRCADGIRTRDVFCRSQIDNMVLPIMECDATTRPVSVVSCATLFPGVCLTDPVWISGEWSRCSRDCGGWRYRSVRCQVPMTGDIRSPSDCRLQPRPHSYDFIGCNTECCIEDRYPVRCRAQGTGYCSDEAFAKECCWTCGRKTIGIRY